MKSMKSVTCFGALAIGTLFVVDRSSEAKSNRLYRKDTRNTASVQKKDEESGVYIREYYPFICEEEVHRIHKHGKGVIKR